MTHEQKPESAEFRTREASAWQPISTAPKDGSYIDLWVLGLEEEFRFENAHYGVEHHDCGEYGRYCDSCPAPGKRWIDAFGMEIAGTVTHWRAIPASPKAEAEQRRKDAEGAEPVGYVRPDMIEYFRQSKALFTSASITPVRDETHTEALYTRPANVAALSASFAWLVEDMRKKDQSAPPLARFDMLFGNDEVSISEARERLKALGIESLYITDDWEDATEGNELSRADVEALPPLHEDEQKAGWKLASAWDTEDGTVIRHYVRPLRTSDQGTANVATGVDISAIIRAVCELPDRLSPEDQPDMMQVTRDELRLILETVQPANVAALEDRVKELEGENKAWSGAATNALTWLENGRQANARDELKAAQRRVAALREGGEHG
ncbi:hypothetical protein [Asaia sp. As-1742]|uniref:hypothetical protein n=1 Tax=Asaia sp. As-1742 TaxID=2608325 RepID=UPI0014230F3A|nr:hypothetical protein [Asaia sp. As-1742]NIE80032.1 hypothetical protein [Asaia sp. As-1742]